MATVYRKTITRAIPTNAELFVGNDGKEYAKLPPSKSARSKKPRIATVIVGKDGSKRIRIEAGTFIAKFRNHLGKVCEISTGHTSEEAAITKLNELVREQVLLKRGVITQKEIAIGDNQAIPLETHLKAYELSLEAAGRTSGHVADVGQKIRRLIDECKFSKFADITREGMEKWLSDQTKKEVAPITRNKYLQSLRSFIDWGIENNRFQSNPLKAVVRANEKLDRRKVRRAMTEEELQRLLRVALLRPLAELGRETIPGDKTKKRSNWTYAPLTLATLDECCNRGRDRATAATIFNAERRGRERMLVYKTLVLTGLRCNELRSITIGQVDIDGPMACIHLSAESEKNRSGSAIPIRADLANDLREWIQSIEDKPGESKPSRQLFDVPDGLIKILDRDLAAAGIDKVDDRGRSLDVHALRTTFGTLLSKSNVAPRTAQAAMRHSRIDLTMNVYTDPRLLDVAGAIEALPTLGNGQPGKGVEPCDSREELRATGTDGGSKLVAPDSKLVAPDVAPTIGKGRVKLGIFGQNDSLADSIFGDEKHEKTLEISTTSRVFNEGDRRDSNSRPSEPQSNALTEFHPAKSNVSTFADNAGCTRCCTSNPDTAEFSDLVASLRTLSPVAQKQVAELVRSLQADQRSSQPTAKAGNRSSKPTSKPATKRGRK